MNRRVYEKEKSAHYILNSYLSLSLAFSKDHILIRISFPECVLEIRDFLGKFFFFKEKGPPIIYCLFEIMLSYYFIPMHKKGCTI